MLPLGELWLTWTPSNRRKWVTFKPVLTFQLTENGDSLFHAGPRQLRVRPPRLLMRRYGREKPAPEITGGAEN